MEFLVHIEVNWPPEGDAEELARLIDAERVRDVELGQSENIRRLWRAPGRRANWGIWQAPNASDLHQAISSLPMYPWLDVEVIALAAHPSDPGWPRSDQGSAP